ncbi:hypothetical protein REC12_11390 [Desulfosporosinus sp. PR]|uniref:hypothetical protein n=1 Tax=Candidatus Desulfosporosinus nitrosoreducens TaxID=3401928 RepID=UPI0027EA1DD8|nr:hypothetical protein [Desulfosporosinus sp. PR]MDQ7094193.1 hypothetical protein [Desulfosporosinus sp. PR]
MNIKGFANMLDGREIEREISSMEEQQAKELGFVVVFGYSDDNTEFRGAIYEEVGCFEGKTIFLDEKGIFEECDCECSHSVLAKEKCKTIKAIWNDGEHGPAWTYETDIPYETFDIMEYGEVWCKGIVFEIKNLVPWDGPAEVMSEKMKEDLLKLINLLKIFCDAGDGNIETEFKAFSEYEEPIETIEQLIEAMEVEMSYWEMED